jgi:hypothetical protein
MVSKGTETPIENCFLSTHHPSVMVHLQIVGSFTQNIRPYTCIYFMCMIRKHELEPSYILLIPLP